MHSSLLCAVLPVTGHSQFYACIIKSAEDPFYKRPMTLWLIDAANGKRKLLADILCKPRWSPDGKQIALGLFTSNEIIVLDTENLDLKVPF